MKQAIISTFFHLLELAIIAAIAIITALAADKFFSLDLKSELVVVLGFVLTGLVKYSRASPSIPVPDYVNEPIATKVEKKKYGGAKKKI